jgi:hypothetical protein
VVAVRSDITNIAKHCPSAQAVRLQRSDCKHRYRDADSVLAILARDQTETRFNVIWLCPEFGSRRRRLISDIRYEVLRQSAWHDEDGSMDAFYGVVWALRWTQKLNAVELTSGAFHACSLLKQSWNYFSVNHW